MTRFRFFTILTAIVLFSRLVPAQNAVTISEDYNSFTLANGVLKAEVSKRSGDLLSLKYKNLEMLDTMDQPQAGYWSHNAAHGKSAVARVTIDPKSNDGRRGEISIKSVYNDGGPAVDVEIRYALAGGDSGLYTYSILTHETNYPATGIGEARFCAKLNDNLFDWMTVDSNRNMEAITAYDWNHGTELNFKEVRRMNTGIYQGHAEHKYDYSANQFDVRTWGWSSTQHHVGIWFINPSVEYLSGGPTKMELSAHRDATFNTRALHAPAPPCLLNYWRSSHYGGSSCTIAATDAWTKVVGPFLIYCNSVGDHNALWQNALARQNIEEKAWPFDWVNGVDYPHKGQRATVSGKIVLNDPQAPDVPLTNLLVGLSAPDYMSQVFHRNFRRRPPRLDEFESSDNGNHGEDADAANNQIRAANRPDASSFVPDHTNAFRSWRRFQMFPTEVSWQTDAKYYQFWVRANTNGNFQIPNVRPGTYTLHAIADGVLGEFVLTNVMIEPGKDISLGSLDWHPVRHGRQLWDIGIPNRNASEFFKGNDYFHWGWYVKYPKLFPDDVHYVIGKSNFRHDWFFEQVPHDEDLNDTNGTGHGRSTTWTVSFTLPDAPHGKATLRLAICGVGTRNVSATMNDRSIGNINDLVYNATINRDGIGGTWTERDLPFNASLMHAGENKLALTIPGGGLTSGIMYDYLRLELDDTKSSGASESADNK